MRVVPKKMSKGEFLRRTFFEGAQPGRAGAEAETETETETETGAAVTCLFVDDDIRELVADSWLREETRVHRVLFARAI